ncbi:MAG TPA: NlpC/P60 family protein [Nocardioidaceae bacterium]|nr:NlpC/P60 family protein [Nocardioidaceae bacterium]
MPTTSHAEPSIDEVEQRLDTLYHEAEVAQERLNTLNHRMGLKKDRLSALRSDLRKQRNQYQRFSNQVAAMAALEAQDVESQLSPTQRLVLAEDPDDFQSKLAAQEALSEHKGATLSRFSIIARKLAVRQQQVSKELASVAADQKQAAEEESTVDSKVADAEDLLSELEAERRAALREQQAEEASRSAPRPAPEPTTSAPASGNAATAVQFAMDQIGDAYVYGAAGPDAWDCSGLTMGAWGAAGVSLPHSSSGQMSSGTPVSQSELQPGDLVFYYSPVSHVGMYIGNGQIVHASNPSSPVSTTSVDSMPYSGAVRPG